MLTGFLGAGKTTLVNRVIAARAADAGGGAGKLAIVVNELGTIGIDGDLLPAGAARQVELPGGCVCCVLADDLDRTILEILDSNPEVDTLLLETTGVAEPVPIVWTLERPPLDARVRVAAIVTVIDPLSWPAARATSSAAEIQLESADVAGALAAFARERGVTLLIVGRPRRRHWSQRFTGSMIDRLVAASAGLDLLVVSGEDQEEQRQGRTP